MRKNPVITVVMPSRNVERFVRQAVESVLAQSCGDFEFIVVDDGSTDETPSLLADLAKHDARMQIIRQENAGVAAARNRAMKISRGQYIAVQDADDVSLPGRFSLQRKMLAGAPNLAMVGCGHAVIDEAGEVLETHAAPVGSSDLKRTLLRKNRLCHGSVMMRRDCLEKIGGYREKFRYSLDYDLFLRMMETADIAIAGETGYLWRKQSGGISQEKKGEQAAYALLARAFALERKKFGADSYADLRFNGKGDLEGIREFLERYRLRNRYRMWAARKFSASPGQRAVAGLLGISPLWTGFFSAARKFPLARPRLGWAK